jgi:hypothetical protein
LDLFLPSFLRSLCEGALSRANRSFNISVIFINVLRKVSSHAYLARRLSISDKLLSTCRARCPDDLGVCDDEGLALGEYSGRCAYSDTARDGELNRSLTGLFNLTRIAQSSSTLMRVAPEIDDPSGVSVLRLCTERCGVVGDAAASCAAMPSGPSVKDGTDGVRNARVERVIALSDDTRCDLVLDRNPNRRSGIVYVGVAIDRWIDR